MGRKKLYETDVEKKQAHNEHQKKYYATHKFYCEVCNKHLCVSAKKYHINSAAHRKKSRYIIE